MDNRQKLSEFTFNALLENSKKNYSHRDAVGYENEKMLSYSELNARIEALKEKLLLLGIEKGDKIAIYSNNSPEWVIVYFATVSIGAVLVPLLPDLQEHEIINILSHSESKILYVSDKYKSKLGADAEAIPETVICMESGRVLKGNLDHVGETPDAEKVNEDDIALIIYTSGTTGSSKAAMLSHKNLIINAIQGDCVNPVYEDDKFLSVLPLSHAYENTLGLLLAVLNGSSVAYLRKPPTASVLVPALKRFRPSIMLTVPLIIEKIVRKKVFDRFENGLITKHLYNIKPIRKLLHLLAGKKIKKTFGGRLTFFGVGGAKLDAKVEEFLIDAKFPYAIGYGLTETAPLSAGCAPFKTKFQSTGFSVKDTDIKISDGNDGGHPGEVLIKGPQVMKGYYKNEALTKEVFTEDGYFRSGDIGEMDDVGRLYLKGRHKNMILGSNGENIYPEDIESIINNYTYVKESVVLERKGKLVALVHLNIEEIENKFRGIREDFHNILDEKIEEIKKELFDFVNKRVSKSSKLQMIVVQNVEFEKTATKKIKRFLYD